ncbi:MAG: hypothetical protein GY947_18975 [Rhodobacteraceae bacterium]|nr:hypothetical protein [Paracoccaceae bacterium]
MADVIISGTSTAPQSLTGTDALIVGSLGNLLVTGTTAVNADGNNDILVNGTIACESNGIFATGSSLELVVGMAGSILSSGGSGVFCNTTVKSQIQNGGEIRGTNAGVTFQNFDSGSLHLVNTGQIVGDTGIEIDNGDSTSTVANSGLIVGESFGIYASYSSYALLRVTNTGMISGSDASFVGSLGTAGSCRIDNAGLMQGDIILSPSDDTYNGRFGTIAGEVYGGDGDDNIRGGAGGETFFGDADGDTLIGRGGNDDLFGGDGTDDLRGGDGDDDLSGGGGSDKLNGGKGDDEITSGGGNDVIVFRRKAGDDTITDFNNGRDVIDLQAFNLTNWGDLNGSGAVTDVTGGVEIDFSLIGGSGILTIAGISVSNLGNPDFIF